jgi:hypothetical protein
MPCAAAATRCCIFSETRFIAFFICVRLIPLSNCPLRSSLVTTTTLQHHVGSTPDSYEPADLQGKEEGCRRWTQIAQEEGRCVKGTMVESNRRRWELLYWMTSISVGQGLQFRNENFLAVDDEPSRVHVPLSHTPTLLYL